jgi:hypothetical protein
VRYDAYAVTLFTTCFYGFSVEPDTFFSYVHPLQACISRTFPCLLLVNCLSMQGYATDARLPVQKQCSRGGRNEHGWHMDKGREKAAPLQLHFETEEYPHVESIKKLRDLPFHVGTAMGHGG